LDWIKIQFSHAKEKYLVNSAGAYQILIFHFSYHGGLKDTSIKFSMEVEYL
jgi:hypothetical protein